MKKLVKTKVRFTYTKGCGASETVLFKGSRAAYDIWIAGNPTIPENAEVDSDFRGEIPYLYIKSFDLMPELATTSVNKYEDEEKGRGRDRRDRRDQT